MLDWWEKAAQIDFLFFSFSKLSHFPFMKLITYARALLRWISAAANGLSYFKLSKFAAINHTATAAAVALEKFRDFSLLQKWRQGTLSRRWKINSWGCFYCHGKITTNWEDFQKYQPDVAEFFFIFLLHDISSIFVPISRKNRDIFGLYINKNLKCKIGALFERKDDLVHKIWRFFK